MHFKVSALLQAVTLRKSNKQWAQQIVSVAFFVSNLVHEYIVQNHIYQNLNMKLNFNMNFNMSFSPKCFISYLETKTFMWSEKLPFYQPPPPTWAFLLVIQLALVICSKHFQFATSGLTAVLPSSCWMPECKKLSNDPNDLQAFRLILARSTEAVNINS